MTWNNLVTQNIVINFFFELSDFGPFTTTLTQVIPATVSKCRSNSSASHTLSGFNTTLMVSTSSWNVTKSVSALPSLLTKVHKHNVHQNYVTKNMVLELNIWFTCGNPSSCDEQKVLTRHLTLSSENLIDRIGQVLEARSKHWSRRVRPPRGSADLSFRRILWTIKFRTVFFNLFMKMATLQEWKNMMAPLLSAIK